MRILLLTIEYPPMIGGVGQYYSGIVHAAPPGSIEVVDNHDHALLFRSRWIWPRWMKALWTIYRMHRVQAIDHIIVGQVIPLGTVALIARFLFGISYTIVTHAMDVTVIMGASGKSRHRVLLRTICSYAAQVIAVSRFTAGEVRQLGVAEEKIHVLTPCPAHTPEQYPVTADRLRALDTEHHIEGKRVVLSAGRLVERKGFQYALMAFERIAQRVPDALFVCIGNGPMRDQLVDMARASSVRDKIHLLPSVDDETLSAWYARCAVYVMPSHTLSNGDAEGFGMTYLEANAFGKPVIAGRSGGIEDAVERDRTGYCVDGTDVDEIAKAMYVLLTDETKARILGSYGQQRVKQAFRWSTRAEQLITWIRNL